MTDNIDDLFSQLDRRSFEDRDPNTTPQEAGAGTGNAQPSGWYTEHGYSSSIGAKNMISDPLMLDTATQSFKSSGESSAFLGHVHNSGTLPTSVTYTRGGTTGVVGITTLQSEGSFLIVPTASATNDTLYATWNLPNAPWSATNAPPNYVCSLRIRREPSTSDPTGNSTATLKLQLVDYDVLGGTYTVSQETDAVDWADIDQSSIYTLRLVNIAPASLPFSTANHIVLMRLKVVVDSGASATGSPQVIFGEPQASFSYDLSPLPFQPQLGYYNPLPTFGADGTVLTAQASATRGMAWSAPTGIQPTIIDAKGDLIAGTSSDTAARLVVGANGKVLMADSGATAGLSYVTDMDAFFGDGSDGSLSSSGTTTLSRDMFYTDVTLTGSGKIVTAGYRVFCNGTLNLGASAVISNNGGDGVAGVDGSAGTVGTGGAAGTTAGNGWDIWGGTAGTAGLDGTAGGTAGVAGNASQTTRTNCIGALTNRAGAGGGNASGGGTAAAGTGATNTVSAGPWRAALTYMSGASNGAGVIGTRGGGGGGGGGGTSLTSRPGGGGGGGAGGGVCLVFARIVTGSGTISANGGAGGNGGNAYNGGSGGGGGGGGGAGGAGGLAVLVYRYLTSWTGTVSANAGASGGGGTGTGTGSNGATPTAAVAGISLSLAI
jgi:hypothetical protein